MKHTHLIEENWTLKAIANRIRTPQIVSDMLSENFESAYTAALAEVRKMPLKAILKHIDRPNLSIETFMTETRKLCHLRAVAVVEYLCDTMIADR